MSFYHEGKIWYDGDDVKDIAVKSAIIRERLRAHDRNAFQMTMDLARDDLMPVSSKFGNDLYNDASYYRYSLNYDATIDSLENNCGAIFKIMVTNIQERKRRIENGTFY